MRKSSGVDFSESTPLLASNLLLIFRMKLQIFFRSHTDHFMELLYKMALGGKRKPVCYFNHRIIAEPE